MRFRQNWNMQPATAAWGWSVSKKQQRHKSWNLVIQFLVRPRVRQKKGQILPCFPKDIN